MPELPWKKWYPQDWKSDPKLDQCSAATRGIWADAISTMMLLGTDYLTGTDEQMARFCRCSNDEIQRAHEELSASQTANVSIQNGYKKWQSRRLHRELNISELRREAVGNRWKKRHTKHHTKHSRSDDTNSASASVLLDSVSSVLKEQPDFEIEWCGFVEMRKAKRAPLTQHAANLILRRLAERPKQAVDALQTATIARWTGFEWSWYDERKQRNNGQGECKQPAPTGAAYKIIPAAREVSDEELEKSREIAKREVEKLKANLR